MTAFRDGVGRLAARTEKEIASLYTRYESGRIDRDTFVSLAAAVISRARASGVSLAELSLMADALRQIGDPLGPVGVELPDGDAERLMSSVESVLDEMPHSADNLEALRGSQRARLARLARDSSVESSVWGMREAMLATGITGWVRQTDMDPCVVCRNLADGVVRSPLVVMKRHTGCCCVQRLVFR